MVEIMNLWDRFLKFEHECNVYEIQVNGIKIWERIRFSIYRQIQSSQGHGQAHSTGPTGVNDTVRSLYQWSKNIIRKNPLLSRPCDCVAMGHSRRKKLEDSNYWDIYVDPFFSSLELDSVYLENRYNGTHLKPAKTNSIRHLDLIDGLAVVAKKLFTSGGRVDNKQKRLLDKINNEICTTFGVNVGVTSEVERLLNRRATQLALFKLLLRRINPQVALVVVSYAPIRQTYIEACQELDIPVIELQHGTIHPKHVGYSFDDERTIDCFPDYLFTWGSSWTENVAVPLPEKRIIPVGYPFLESRVEKFSNQFDSDQILFLSQGTIGESLSKFAVKLHDDSRIDSNIVYKLHPGEYDRWKSTYPWLAESDVRIIDDNNPPLYSLFAESRYQIGVYSTALYEGLAFDNKTLLYDGTVADIEHRLIDDAVAAKVSSVEDVIEQMAKHSKDFDVRTYFCPNATQQMCEMIEKVANQGSCYNPAQCQ